MPDLGEERRGDEATGVYLWWGVPLPNVWSSSDEKCYLFSNHRLPQAFAPDLNFRHNPNRTAFPHSHLANLHNSYHLLQLPDCRHHQHGLNKASAEESTPIPISLAKTCDSPDEELLLK